VQGNPWRNTESSKSFLLRSCVRLFLKIKNPCTSSGFCPPKINSAVFEYCIQELLSFTNSFRSLAVCSRFVIHTMPWLWKIVRSVSKWPTIITNYISDDSPIANTKMHRCKTDFKFDLTKYKMLKCTPNWTVYFSCKWQHGVVKLLAWRVFSFLKLINYYSTRYWLAANSPQLKDLKYNLIKLDAQR